MATTERRVKVGVDVVTNIDKTSLNNLQQQLDRLVVQGKTASIGKNIQEGLVSAGKEAEKLRSILDQSWNSKLGQLDFTKVNNSIKETWGSAEKLGTALTSSGKEGAEAFASFSSMVLNSNIQLRQGSKILNDFAVTFKNTVRYGLSSSIYNNLANSLQKAYNYTKNLDTSLNDIRIVSNKSADDMERFAVQANKAAKSLGRATLDYTNASLIYYQQGLSEAEVEARTNVTLKAANVTGQSAQDVSEQLTAVWNGYNVSVEQSEEYIDKLAAVAASTAADLEELSTGMSKVASAANIMGVPIDSLNAQLATIVSVTKQAPESVGTALRTIYARMADIEAGLDEETTLGNYTAQMKELGVNVLDAEGNLRNMGDVITEVGNNWVNMSREQQVALAQVMAGTRQYNNLLALFGSWDMYNDALQTSLNSAGELQRQQDIYMESTEAHLQQLRTEAERTYKTIFDQETAKSFIDTIEGALSVLNNYLQGLGGGMKTLSTLGLQVANIFSSQISESIARQMQNAAQQKNMRSAEQTRDTIANTIYDQGYKSLSSESQARVDAEFGVYDKIKNVKSVLTEEDQQWLITKQEEIGKLAEEKEIHAKILESVKARADVDTTNVGIQEALSGAIQEENNNIKDNNKRLSDSNKKIKEYDKQIREINKNRENGDKSNKSQEKTLNQIIKNKKEELNNQKEITKQIDKSKEKIKEHQKYQEELNGISEDSVAEEQYIINKENDRVEKYVELKKNQQEINSLLRGATTILSTVTASMGIWDTLTNEDLSGWEKFESILSVVAVQGLMLVKNWDDVTSFFPKATEKLKNFNTTLAAHNTETATEIATKTTENTVEAVGVVTKEAGAEAQKDQNKNKEEGIIATIGHTIALEAENVQLALQKLLMGDVTALGLAAAAAIIAGTVAIGVWIVKMTEANSNETKLKEAIEETSEKVQEAKDAYGELSDTVSKYRDARSGIDELTEGTIEFYDAIIKSNEAAQELIDKFNLLPGQGYTIDAHGLINIDEDVLEDELFRAQQEMYRTMSHRDSAQARYVRESTSDSGLRGLYRDFSREVESLTRKAGVFGAVLSDDQAEKILSGEDGYLEILGTVNGIYEISKEGFKNVDESVQDTESTIETTNVDLTKTVSKYLAKYNELQAKARSYELVAADEAIRGYGSREDVERYSELSSSQQNVIQQSVSKAIEENQQKSDKGNIWTNAISGAIAGAGMGAAAGAPTGIGAIPGAIAGLLGGFGGGIVGTIVGNKQLDKRYKEMYAVNAMGYEYEDEEEGILRDTETGRILSDEDKKKLLDKIDSDIAEAAFESGEYITEEATKIIMSQMDAARIAASQYVDNLGQTFDEESQNYISSAIVAAQDGLDFDYSTLNAEELEYVKEQLGDVAEVIGDVIPSATARAEQDLKNYNDELSAQASALGTTEKALKLYAKTMRDANGDMLKLNQTTAKAVAASYSFNKAYNEGVSTFKDSEDAFKDWIKAARNGTNVSYDVVDAVAEIQTKLEDLLGIEVSEDFMDEYAGDIQKLFSGTEAEAKAAYKRLQQASVVNAFVEQVGMAETEVINLLNSISNLNPGEALNQNWSNALVEMVNKSHLTLQQVEDLFASAHIAMPSVDDYTLTENTIESEGTRTTHHYAGDIPTGKIIGGEPQKVYIEYSWDEWTEPVKQKYFTFNDQKVTLRKDTSEKGAAFGKKSSATNFKKSSSSSSSKESDPKEEDYIESEVDRYHDVNIELDLLSNKLDELENKKEKLFGKDLLENLNEQIETLNDHIEITSKKLAIAQGEQEELRQSLSEKGVTFDERGVIDNYLDAYQTQLNTVNAVIEKYNSMSADQQEKYQKTLDEAKEQWEKFNEEFERYDELETSVIPDLRAQRQEDIDKQIENRIEIFDYEIEIRLDMAEAERDWNQFKKKVIDGVKDSDILGNAEARLQDFYTYYNSLAEGAIQVNTQHVADILEDLKRMDEGQAAQIYGDGIDAANNNRQKALEELQNYYGQLMGDLEDVLDIQEEIHEAYLDQIDEVQDKFEEQINAYETIRDLIEHDMNVIQMVYGEEAYGILSKYYERQEENYNKQLDFQRQQKDFWYAQMQTMEEGSEEWEAAKENWLAAVDEWNSAVEEAIENLQDKYLNAINEIFQELNNQATRGKGLDYIEEEWELINKNAEQYLDTIDATWGIQQLENKYMDAYDQTDSIQARRQIKDIMDDELGILREQDKLTQYDLDRANKRYDIMLKQIALQEAQQNKSQMRLRRDSQGNYSYQFVADNDEVSKLQDELGNLYNSLYDFDRDHYIENLNNIYDLWVEFQEKMAEAAQINDPEERAARELLIRQQYEPLLNGLLKENLDIRNNLEQSAFEDLAYLYEEDADNFINMTEEEKQAYLEELIPQMRSGIKELADYVIGEGGFLPAVQESLEKLDNTTEQYEKELQTLQEVAGQSFGQMAEDIDSTVEKAKDLVKENKDLITSQERELSAARELYDQIGLLIERYGKQIEIAKDATTAAHDYFVEVNSQAANVSEKIDSLNKSLDKVSSKADQVQNKVNKVVESSNTQLKEKTTTNPSPTKDTTTKSPDVCYVPEGSLNSSGFGGGSGGGGFRGTDYNVGDKVRSNAGPYVLGYSYNSKTGDINTPLKLGGTLAWLPVTATKTIIKKKEINGKRYYGVGDYRSKIPEGWVEEDQIKYNTGGYTGNWNGEDGKLAFLHQKELVLNSTDTQNILNAVNVMRGLSGAMLDRLSAISASTTTGSFDGMFEQNVHIDATFPNVQNSKEIEDALNNLVNRASQRVGQRG